MDAKESQIVRDLSRRVRERTFNERDILALLIVLRPHAEANFPLHEISDFVAHREKDRGALQRYVRHVVAYGEAMVAGTTAELQISAVHSAVDFQASINSALARFDLSELPRAVADDVLTCVMVLLQDVRLHHKKTEMGRLQLYRFKKELWLCGEVVMTPKQVRVVFPALIVANRCCAHTEECERFPGLVEAKCAKNRLQLYLGGKKAA